VFVRGSCQALRRQWNFRIGMKVFWMRQVPGGVDRNSEDFEMERDTMH
jgi:hypothetical protein